MRELMGETITSSKAGTTLPVAETLTSIVPRSTSEMTSAFLSNVGIICVPSHAAMPSTARKPPVHAAAFFILRLRCSLTGICLSIV